MNGPGRADLYLLGAILVCTVVVFWPTLSHDFTAWDDPVYVTENGEPWSIHHVVAGNYHPVTMATLAIDRLRASSPDGQLSAAAFHATNLLLHLVNTVLVFILVLALFERDRIVATATALLFAIHPMHVESVAWISARKDVVYALFYLAALLVYVSYLRSERGWKLAACFALFVLSLLSKPAAVVLPLVLVLLELHLGRKLYRRTWLRVAPFLAASAAMGLITLETQTQSIDVGRFDLIERVIIASHGIVTYVLKALLPLHLSALHPYPAQIDGIYYLMPVLALGWLLLTVWSYRGHADVFFGLVFYLINVSLVLQFLSVGSAVIAERYTYVAYIGLFAIVGAGLRWAVRRPRLRVFAVASFVLFAVLCGVASHRRTAVWADAMTLWTSVIDAYPQTAHKAYVGRGVLWRAQGALDRALDDYGRAIEIDDRYASAFLNRGNVHRDVGKRSRQRNALLRSLADLDRAAALAPDDPAVHTSRGLTRFYLGDTAGALDSYAAALELDPSHLPAYQNRAKLRVLKGDFRGAFDDYSAYLELRPDATGVRLFRGNTALETGRFELARSDFDRCIEQDPERAACYDGRARAHQALGDPAAARRDAASAERLRAAGTPNAP